MSYSLGRQLHFPVGHPDDPRDEIDGQIAGLEDRTFTLLLQLLAKGNLDARTAILGCRFAPGSVSAPRPAGRLCSLERPILERGPRVLRSRYEGGRSAPHFRCRVPAHDFGAPRISEEIALAKRRCPHRSDHLFSLIRSGTSRLTNELRWQVRRSTCAWTVFSELIADWPSRMGYAQQSKVDLWAHHWTFAIGRRSSIRSTVTSAVSSVRRRREPMTSTRICEATKWIGKLMRDIRRI